jgi:hypothetical protein
MTTKNGAFLNDNNGLVEVFPKANSSVSTSCTTTNDCNYIELSVLPHRKWRGRALTIISSWRSCTRTQGHQSCQNPSNTDQLIKNHDALSEGIN